MKNVVLNGICCYADRYAIRHDRETVHYVSICGPRQSVDSILSALVTGSSVDFQTSGPPAKSLAIDNINYGYDYSTAKRCISTNYKFKMSNTSYGRTHGLIVDSRCLLMSNATRLSKYDKSQYIIGCDKTDADRKFGLFLRQKPIPFLMEWIAWFISKLLTEEHLTVLSPVYNCYGYAVDYKESVFLETVSDGLKNREISF